MLLQELLDQAHCLGPKKTRTSKFKMQIKKWMVLKENFRTTLNSTEKLIDRNGITNFESNTCCFSYKNKAE